MSAHPVDPVISIHRYPYPLIRRANRRLTRLLLILMAATIPVQIGVALVAMPLLLGTALFTVMLMLPILLHSVLHPEVAVTEHGLTLRPLLWGKFYVAWEQIVGVIDHPLIYEDPVFRRKFAGKAYRPREGMVIVLRHDTPIHPLFQLVGVVAGCGLQPAFAMSSTTHTDYAALIQTITARRSEQAPVSTSERV